MESCGRKHTSMKKKHVNFILLGKDRIFLLLKIVTDTHIDLEVDQIEARVPSLHPEQYIKSTCTQPIAQSRICYFNNSSYRMPASLGTSKASERKLREKGTMVAAIGRTHKSALAERVVVQSVWNINKKHVVDKSVQ